MLKQYAHKDRSETPRTVPPEGWSALIEDLLAGPCRILDILPAQVPRDCGGQYFAVERYFLQPERRRDRSRRYGELLLKLNCYAPMAVTFDACGHWEWNPDPEPFVHQLEAAEPGSFLRVLFPEEKVMLDLDFGDTWMTVYGEDPVLLGRMEKLAGPSGFFLWRPPET